jgi:hypothetical protein
LITELNDYITQATPGPSGNVSVPLRVESIQQGSIMFHTLNLTLSASAPGNNLISYPAVMVPDGNLISVVTDHVDFKGATDLKEAYLLFNSSSSSDPVLRWNETNDSFWKENDPQGYIVLDPSSSSIRGATQVTLNWNFTTTFDWTRESDVEWEINSANDDGNWGIPIITTTADVVVENALEIVQFSVTDSLPPYDGPALLTDGEWVRGADPLVFSGQVNFYNTVFGVPEADFDLEIYEDGARVASLLTATNGLVSGIINTKHFTDHDVLYEMFLSNISGTGQELTQAGSVRRTINVDGTAPTITLISPTDSYIPTGQKNVSVTLVEDIASTTNYTLYYWIENISDDGDGVPQEVEYSSTAMQGSSGSGVLSFWGGFNDGPNANLENVSFYITGSDHVGNEVVGGGDPGFATDLHNYINSVQAAAVLDSVQVSVPLVVPGQRVDLVVELHDPNTWDDLEGADIVLSTVVGPSSVISWDRQSGTFSSGLDIMVWDHDVVYGPWATGEVTLTINFSVTGSYSSYDGLNSVEVTIREMAGPDLATTARDIWTFDTDLAFELGSVEFTDLTGLVSGPMQNGWALAAGDQVDVSGRIVLASGDPLPDVGLLGTGDLVEYRRGSATLMDSGSVDVAGNFSLSATILASGTASGDVIQLSVRLLNPWGGMVTTTEGTQLTVSLDSSPPQVGSLNITEIDASTVDRVGFSFVVTDDQAVAAGSIRVHFVHLVDGSVLDELELSGLGPVVDNFRETVHAIVDLTSGGAWDVGVDDEFRVWFEAIDTAGNPLLQSGSNPYRTIPVNLHSSDLWVKEVYTNPASGVLDGDRVSVSATVRNMGDRGASDVWVSLAADDKEVGRVRLPVLSDGSEQTVSFSYDAEEGDVVLKVVADPDGSILELDEGNNEYTLVLSVGPPESALGSVGLGGGSGTIIALAVMLLLVLIVVAIVVQRKKRQGYMADLGAYGYDPYDAMATGFGMTEDFTGMGGGMYGYTDMAPAFTDMGQTGYADPGDGTYYEEFGLQ